MGRVPTMPYWYGEGHKPSKMSDLVVLGAPLLEEGTYGWALVGLWYVVWREVGLWFLVTGKGGRGCT